MLSRRKQMVLKLYKGPYVSKIAISGYKPDQKKSYIDSSKAARIKFAIDV